MVDFSDNSINAAVAILMLDFRRAAAALPPLCFACCICDMPARAVCCRCLLPLLVVDHFQNQASLPPEVGNYP